MKKLDKIEKVEPPKIRKIVDFDFRTPPRSGEDVAKLRRRRARATARGRSTTASTSWSGAASAGACMGVNGAGKSTLLKMVAGESQPDAGTVTVGASVKMGYFAQHAMELLDPERDGLGDAAAGLPQGLGRRRCGRWPAASASPATRSRRRAGCSPAARRPGWCWP